MRTVAQFSWLVAPCLGIQRSQVQIMFCARMFCVFFCMRLSTTFNTILRTSRGSCLGRGLADYAPGNPPGMVPGMRQYGMGLFCNRCIEIPTTIYRLLTTSGKAKHACYYSVLSSEYDFLCAFFAFSFLRVLCPSLHCRVRAWPWPKDSRALLTSYR